MLRINLQLRNLLRIRDVKPPGISRLYFIPVEAVKEDPRLFSGPGVIGTLPLMTAKLSVARIENFARDYKEEQKTGDGGPYFETTVSGFLPAESQVNHQSLDAMKYHRYIVLVQANDQSMIKWLGSKDSPCTFSQSFGSGKRHTGSTGSLITFSCTSQDRPFLLNPGIIIGPSMINTD